MVNKPQSKHQLAARATVIFKRIDDRSRRGYITITDIKDWVDHGQMDFFPQYMKDAADLLDFATQNPRDSDQLKQIGLNEFIEIYKHLLKMSVSTSDRDSTTAAESSDEAHSGSFSLVVDPFQQKKEEEARQHKLRKKRFQDMSTGIRSVSNSSNYGSSVETTLGVTKHLSSDTTHNKFARRHSFHSLAHNREKIHRVKRNHNEHIVVRPEAVPTTKYTDEMYGVSEALCSKPSSAMSCKSKSKKATADELLSCFVRQHGSMESLPNFRVRSNSMQPYYRSPVKSSSSVHDPISSNSHLLMTDHEMSTDCRSSCSRNTSDEVEPVLIKLFDKISTGCFTGECRTIAEEHDTPNSLSTEETVKDIFGNADLKYRRCASAHSLLKYLE